MKSPKNKLKTFTSYHVATLPILPPVAVLHFATITTRRMMSPSNLKNLDQRISPPGWEEANPIFFQFQGDTLQGTITYPTKREKENHLPKCRLVGDMFVPRRDMWSFPVSFFFFFLVGGSFCHPVFQHMCKSIWIFFASRVEHQTTNLPFAEECIYPPWN